MSLKVIITGATGMVGEGVLQECIANPMVEKILLINRKTTGVVHSKVKEIIHQHFNNLTPILDELKGYDACYFCLGITSLGVKEETYYDVTYKLTTDFARQLTLVNDHMTFCYVSGAGTDSSEKGKLMWARIKGKTENDLTKLPFKAVYNFRPGFMRPTKGAKNIKGFYKVIDFLYPLFRSISPTYFLTLEEVAKAMINVTIKGYSKSVITIKDIAILSKINI